MDEELLTSEEELKREVKVDKSRDQHRERVREQKSQQQQKMSIKQLEAWFGAKKAIKNINLDIREKLSLRLSDLLAVVKQLFLDALIVCTR